MSVSLEVSKRALRPRANRNKLRHEGQIPGIINGYQIESIKKSSKSCLISSFCVLYIIQRLVLLLLFLLLHELQK